jgi:hypothetical protein
VALLFPGLGADHAVGLDPAVDRLPEFLVDDRFMSGRKRLAVVGHSTDVDGIREDMSDAALYELLVTVRVAAAGFIGLRPIPPGVDSLRRAPEGPEFQICLENLQDNAIASTAIAP